MAMVARRLMVLALGACAFAGAGWAQRYPTKPIRIVVPFAPGGPTDVQARWAAQQLTAAFGEPVIVENRPGAGGVTGTEAVVKSAPDGYTLLAGNPGPLTIAPSVHAQLPYDTLRDLAPIILIAKSASCLCVRPDLPAKDIDELVALAKARPGRLNYGSPGVGTVGHLATELFAAQVGIKLNHIPYKGAAPYTVDLVNGNIDIALMQFAGAVPLLKQGKLRALGVTSRTRSALLPEVPTLAEQGLADYQSYNWNGVLAPAGTPSAVLARIYDILAKQLATPAARELFLAQGHELGGIGLDDYAAFIRAEIGRWAQAAATAGVPRM